jgi:hypothetical protein
MNTSSGPCMSNTSPQGHFRKRCAGFKSFQEMMDFIEANYARDNQVNRDDIVQQGGNEEDQDASQKRDKRCDMSDGKGHIKLPDCGVVARVTVLRIAGNAHAGSVRVRQADDHTFFPRPRPAQDRTQ